MSHQKAYRERMNIVYIATQKTSNALSWRHEVSRHSPAPLEFLLVGGFVSAVLSCAAAALAFSDIPDRVVTVAITVAVYATRGRSLISASATATMAWMFLTGFLVNDAGTLTFSPDDRVRLGILLAIGLLGGAVGVLRALQLGGRPGTGGIDSLLCGTL
ncbi:hypothetical protein Misp03_59770 [Microbispora sp. NBRC 16548]|nr:hypothetical protein Misp03_59770 [Microbispora sp. NBRC 16548]